MKLYGLIIILFLCAVPGVLAQNSELKILAEEDQAYRNGQNVTRTDEDRIKLVLELLAKGAAVTPQDKFNAALVLQHTPATYCEKRLVSMSPDNYLLAHYLSKESFEAGYKDARVLVADSIDRYLSMTQGYQKYGTNTFIDQKTGKEEFPPIDRKTTDAERAIYGVAPLAELLQQHPEQAPRPKPAAKGKKTKAKQ